MRAALTISRRGLAATLGASLVAPAAHAQITLLNVSYDPTRELYRDIDRAFPAAWAAQGGEPIVTRSTHGGSGAQARSVLDGLQADVVTLALASDIDALAERGLLARDWQSRLPDNATPYTSTIVFLVRKGNPKRLLDWSDLIRPDVSIITPNPKTSGGARWNYLAAWGWALRQPGGSEAGAEAFLGKLFKQVPVLDSGARGATNTFVQRGLGDVLLAWENEALLAADELGPDKFDIIYPSLSILAEPPVAVVDKVVDARGTRPAAEAYLRYLYTPAGQDIVGRRHFRPRDAAAQAKYAAKFPKLPLFDITAIGGWPKVQAAHFADGGIFDRIYTPGR
jgi:sulfate transport system substrate-binding protein